MDGPQQRRKPYTLYQSGSAAAEPGAAPGPGGDEQAERLPQPSAEPGGAGPRGRRLARAQRHKRRRGRQLLAAAGLVAALAAVVTLTLASTGLIVGTDDDASGGDPTTQSSGPAGASGTGPSPSPTASPAPAPDRFTITAGGDVIGGFGVAAQLRRSGAGVFKAVAPWFEKSDVGFVNLESPITADGDPQAWKDVVIKGDPALAPALAESGINVVTMANNHAGDQGDSGLLDTFAAARAQDITVVGAGVDLRHARAGSVVKTDAGPTVAFLGFTDVLPLGYPATGTSPGVSPGRADPAAANDAIAAAADRADFVIVGWHWNFEFKTAPTALERQEGKAAVDAGADIVFAHHPHVLDGVERYRGGLIFYSLGNLVFSGWSGDTAETIIVRASVTRHRINARLIPVLLSPEGVPSVATGADASRILERVRRLSADLGTTVTIEDGYGWVQVRR